MRRRRGRLNATLASFSAQYQAFLEHLGGALMSFVFYDTETTGIDTSFDQILQFAAIRTDDDLNELDRFEIRCRLLPHIIPAPRALLTTGVTPAMLTDLSLPSHYQAVCKIADTLAGWSPATFIGYNTMDFDEHLLRQAFYQNLKPVYLTNTNRNRRADILKLVDAAIVFAPQSITVPLSEKGRPSRRLDAIAPANGFCHDNAHDALADVEATIHMARLIRSRQPKLWDALMATSAKDSAIEQLCAHEALALVESRYGRQNVVPVTWCGQNPNYSAQVAAFDLRRDPADFLNSSVEDLIAVMRAPKSPFRVIQANSNPIVLPLTGAPEPAIVDCPSSGVIASRVQVIQRSVEFQTKVGDAIAGRYPERASSEFVEERIYDAFPTSADTLLASRFHMVPWEARRALLDQMRDERLRDLGLRLIGAEAGHLLSEKERVEFKSWQLHRRNGPAPKEAFRTIDQACNECRDGLEGASPEERLRLEEILAWLESQAAEVELADRALG